MGVDITRIFVIDFTGILSCGSLNQGRMKVLGSGGGGGGQAVFALNNIKLYYDCKYVIIKLICIV